MPTTALATFAAILSTFRGHFTAPTFVRFILLVVGWLLTCDPSAGCCVTEALVAARVAGQMHWAAFHRFFSRAVWDPDRLGQTLFHLLEPLLSSSWIEVAVDDTVTQKRGPHVFGASMHVDAVTSTKKRKNLVRGHCWVELGVVVNIPWSKRAWFIPLLSRLYRGKKEAGAEYRTKSALGREMVDLVLTWVDPSRKVRLLLDSGYMGRTMLRGLPFERVTVFGSLKTNAALYRPTSAGQGRSKRKRRGRPRKMGTRLPTPAMMHREPGRRWTTITFQVSQRERQNEVLSLKAQWYGVLGTRINHVVLMREDSEKLRVVLCTDETLPKESILEQGARRWPIEVWNREVKQFFGFADSPAWSKQAVLRTAPWVALASGLLVVWFHRIYTKGMEIPLPERPWYVGKKDLTFADLLRAAQETLRGVDALDFAVAILERDPNVFKGASGEKKAVERRGTEEQEMAKAA
jgi:DDE superfamily endonuclease